MLSPNFLILNKDEMDNLIELLQDKLSGQAMDQLTRNIGAESRDQTEAATNGIVSTLVAALSKNAANEEGGSALLSALDRDHDGSIFDNLSGFLGGQQVSANNKALNGAGILQHVLGSKQSNVTEMVSKMSGLDSHKISQLMVTLAPIVMGALGKAKAKQEQPTQSGIFDLLSKSVRSEANKSTESNLLTRILDADNDGSIMDDIANFGIKAFLRRK